MAKLDWDNTMVVKVLDRPIQRLEAVGIFVEGAAKLLCPVDSGNLRDSINHKVESIGAGCCCQNRYSRRIRPLCRIWNRGIC